MIDREEQQIDALLNALGAVEPATGMQDRILQRLAQQPEAVSAPRSRIALWSLGFALAAGVIAAVAMHHTPAPAPVIARSQPAPNRAPEVLLPTVATIQVQRTTPLPNRQIPAEVPVLVADRGAAALPSMVAPEAPLSDQERQLLRIAHHPDRADLALLNPQLREEIAHQSAADFERFFPKPTPQEIYLAEHSEN